MNNYGNRACVQSRIYSIRQTCVFNKQIKCTYPISGLAPGRSAPFVHVNVTVLSVVFKILGVPGGDRKVLGSGVRCSTGELLFST